MKYLKIRSSKNLNSEGLSNVSQDFDTDKETEMHYLSAKESCE